MARKQDPTASSRKGKTGVARAKGYYRLKLKRDPKGGKLSGFVYRGQQLLPTFPNDEKTQEFVRILQEAGLKPNAGAE